MMRGLASIILAWFLALSQVHAQPAWLNNYTAPTPPNGDNSNRIATTAFVLANGGGGGGVTPSPLTRVNDTNVTLTLGGTPATALLQSVSITAGWAGTLAPSRGGCGGAWTASNGGIFYSDASQCQVLAGTATAGQMLRSGSSAAPTWSTATWPSTTTSGEVLYSNGNNVVAGLGTAAGAILNTNGSGVPSITRTPVIGFAGAGTGTLGFSGTTSGTVTIQPQAAAGTYNFNLPTTAGSAGQVLTSQGGGSTAMTWSSASGSPGGSNTQVQFNNSGAFGGSANLTWVSPTLSIGSTGGATGQLALLGTTSGTVTVQPQAAAGTYNFNLPTAAGTSGQPLLSGGGGASAMTFGTLAVSAGGTGITSGTSGGVPYFSGSTTIASSAALTSGGVMVGGGAGAAPSTIANGQLPGTTTNDNAAAGKVGEYVSSTVTSGSAVALTTTTAADITSISLTAGDWDVWINAAFVAGATTVTTVAAVYVSTVSATVDNTPGRFGAVPTPGAGITGGNGLNLTAGPTRLSLSGTTTVYFVGFAVFTTSTLSLYGIIQARRAR